MVSILWLGLSKRLLMDIRSCMWRTASANIGAADSIFILSWPFTAGQFTVSVDTSSFMGLSSIFFTPFSRSTTWDRNA